MDFKTLVTKYRPKIIALAKECHIRTVKIFGSVVRNETNEDSDVDFIITVSENASLLDVWRFKWKAEEILHKRVDIAFENKFHSSVANKVFKEAQVL